MSYLSVCAIVKDEGRYIAEWMCYHSMLGVEHFYLYLNDCTDDTLLQIERFQPARHVTVIDWPEHPGQFSAYVHAITKFSRQTHWCAFIDADEFIVPGETDDITRVLRDHEDHSALCVNWLIFGSSGHLTRPQGFVIENFTWRPARDHLQNRHVKSIVKLSEVVRPKTVHWFHTTNGSVDENECPVTDSLHDRVSVEKIRINHYFTKSREEWVGKRERGQANVARNSADWRKSDAHFKRDDVRTVNDTRMHRFVDRLRDHQRAHLVSAARAYPRYRCRTWWFGARRAAARLGKSLPARR